MLFLISIKRLRKTLETHVRLAGWNDPASGKISDRITIKRKKKMIIEETPNGGAKLKRRNVIKIEIIE